MKLLLTSANISNKKIEAALEQMLEKPFSEAKLAFIPTAANVEAGDKDWLVKDYIICRDLGLKELDIVDISAIPKEMWQPRLENADVLSFGGGNTFHLMHWIRESGLQDLLPELLKTRVYVGTSAGSMVTAKNFEPAYVTELYNENRVSSENPEGLGFVDFLILPHYGSPHFPNVSKENISRVAEKIEDEAYALDDDSAVSVVDSKVEVISEGKWEKIN